MTDLQKFDNAIWTMAGDDARMYGIPFATRMTIIRLKSGGLWIHSPVLPNAERLAAVNELGPVKHLIAPNKIHSLGIDPWKARYPEAKVWVSPQFNQRHPRIKADAILDNDPPPVWRGEIDQCIFDGSLFLDEVLFVHQPSRTLIVTDLIQKHDPAAQSWFSRHLKKFAGVLGKDGGTALDLRATFRDRSAARRSLERILHWDFDNLIISHGLCVHGGARPVVEKAFSWLGGS